MHGDDGGSFAAAARLSSRGQNRPASASAAGSPFRQLASGEAPRLDPLLQARALVRVQPYQGLSGVLNWLVKGCITMQ